MIYFDNAATSGKKPQNVINAVDFAMKNLSANPGRSGHDLSAKTADAVYKSREKISRFFGGGGGENVIFTLNCTQSINYVLKGVLKRGDHLVISNLEHNAVMRPLKKMGINYDMAEIEGDTETTLKNIMDKIKINTKLVLMTGASNVTGQILPIGEIGRICKQRGVLFCVDAAQIAGVLPIDMEKMNIDYLCVAAHKGLYAPMGIGILIARNNIENTIIEGGTGSSSIDFSQPDILPEKFESGTINVPAIMGVSAGIDYINSRGIENIYKHEFALLERLYNLLSYNKDIVLYTKPPVYNFTSPVLPFNIDKKECSETAKILNDYGIAVRSGLHCAPTAHKAIGTLPYGCVRVSFGVFNTMSEVEKMINMLKDKKIVKKL